MFCMCIWRESSLFNCYTPYFLFSFMKSSTSHPLCHYLLMDDPFFYIPPSPAILLLAAMHEEGRGKNNNPSLSK